MLSSSALWPFSFKRQILPALVLNWGNTGTLDSRWYIGLHRNTIKSRGWVRGTEKHSRIKRVHRVRRVTLDVQAS